MKIGIMQPYFFPYIGYWQLINAVDKYVIYDDVNYIKRGWINRNRILINGEAKMMTLHIKGASQNKYINEIEILDIPIYKEKLIRKIENCYCKSPYFSEAFPIIAKIINKDEKKLHLYLEYSIKTICKYLGIETEIMNSSSIIKNDDLKGSDKIIEICKKLDADEYYNSIGGQNMYCSEEFKKNNMNLFFLKTRIKEYDQFNNEFISNLSIIDVMMFNSAMEIKSMLDDYDML